MTRVLCINYFYLLIPLASIAQWTPRWILNPYFLGSNLGNRIYIYIFYVSCFFCHFYYSANSTLLSLLRFSYFITPYDAQASSAFSALIFHFTHSSTCYITYKTSFQYDSTEPMLLAHQGWQKDGKYSYFPGRLEILVIPGKYW